jgi:hypothetical protein
MEMDWHAAFQEEAELLRLVGDAVAETPAFVMESGRGVYTWHSVDAELDSLLRSNVDGHRSGRVPAEDVKPVETGFVRRSV